MRLFMATCKHETNTFSPVPTRYERFQEGRPFMLRGADVVKVMRGTKSVTGGFLQVAQDYSAEVVYSILANAPPSGKVEQAAFERMADEILEDLRQGGEFDGILLDLHGAMVAEKYDDAETELIARVRKIAPSTPIGVSLDMHGNIYPGLIEQVTVLYGYHSYPHVDMFETGHRAALLLCRAIRGEIKPALYWGNRPMLPHIMRQGTHGGPNRELQAMCRQLEEKGEVLGASVFTGFPHADIEQAGLSCVVCVDGSKDEAKRHGEALLDAAWQRREQFNYRGKPLNDVFQAALASRKQAGARPAVLLDHCDNCASGGTLDTTLVLKAAIEHDLQNAVFYAIYDPEAIRQAIAAGIGAEVRLTLGGKSSLASVGDPNPPLEIQGRVKLISDGTFTRKGPMYGGVPARIGTAVVLQVGGIRVVLISSYVEPHDLNNFRSLGIELAELDFIVIKSRVHWRSGLQDIVGEVFECDSVGVTTSDYSKLKFDKVRRPVFPLDKM
jgi:microcystin degradation protein MlrC